MPSTAASPNRRGPKTALQTDYPGQNVEHPEAVDVPGDLFRERSGRGLCVLCGQSAPCNDHTSGIKVTWAPDPAYAKMSDEQLIYAQNLLEAGMDQLEQMEKDWSPSDAALHDRYLKDFRDIEKEQSARWRDLMEAKGS